MSRSSRCLLACAAMLAPLLAQGAQDNPGAPDSPTPSREAQPRVAKAPPSAESAGTSGSAREAAAPRQGQAAPPYAATRPSAPWGYGPRWGAYGRPAPGWQGGPPHRQRWGAPQGYGVPAQGGPQSHGSAGTADRGAEAGPTAGEDLPASGQKAPAGAGRSGPTAADAAGAKPKGPVTFSGHRFRPLEKSSGGKLGAGSSAGAPGTVQVPEPEIRKTKEGFLINGEPPVFRPRTGSGNGRELGASGG